MRQQEWIGERLSKGMSYQEGSSNLQVEMGVVAALPSPTCASWTLLVCACWLLMTTAGERW